jgi:hypothetical protein
MVNGGTTNHSLPGIRVLRDALSSLICGLFMHLLFKLKQSQAWERAHKTLRQRGLRSRASLSVPRTRQWTGILQCAIRRTPAICGTHTELVQSGPALVAMPLPLRLTVWAMLLPYLNRKKTHQKKGDTCVKG